jgi:hypothetical protein
MWIPQPISCGIHMKSEIPVDKAAACARAPRPSSRTALTVTTRHVSQRLAVAARVPQDVSGLRVRRSREDEQ